MVSKRKKTSKAFLIGPLILVLLLAGVVGYQIAWQVTKQTHAECTVTDKDRTRVTDSNGNSSSDARVYTDCGVFVVADNFWTFNFASADTYGKLEVGKTYTFDSIGWRLPFFSIFPNILEVH